jgi:hypothetical protein
MAAQHSRVVRPSLGSRELRTKHFAAKTASDPQRKTRERIREKEVIARLRGGGLDRNEVAAFEFGGEFQSAIALECEVTAGTLQRARLFATALKCGEAGRGTITCRRIGPREKGKAAGGKPPGVLGKRLELTNLERVDRAEALELRALRGIVWIHWKPFDTEKAWVLGKKKLIRSWKFREKVVECETEAPSR